MSVPFIAVACAKSFGDFVIAHSVLDKVDEAAKHRTRLISCSHVEQLNAVLSARVAVTLMTSGAGRVPAVFDVKKRGTLAALQSAYSLRRDFQNLARRANESLAFDSLGVRERFIAGRWPAVEPQRRAPNIYETYHQLLADHEIQTSRVATVPLRSAIRSVGIFPESRLVSKQLSDATLSMIVKRIARAGLEAKLVILKGDTATPRHYPCLVDIPRDFASLTNALKSVDSVISADSLPAHLAEYLGRPVFVASCAPNEYWLPYQSFTEKRWGLFNDPAGFCASLDRFFVALGVG